MAYFAQHRLLHGQLVFEDLRIEFVQAGVHHLHAYPDVALAIHGSIEMDRIGAIAGSHRNIQIHDQTLLFTKVHCHWDALDGQHCARLPVSHLLHDAVGTAAQIANLLQAVRIDVKCLFANLYGCPGVQITRWHAVDGM